MIFVGGSTFVVADIFWKNWKYFFEI
jgi:hypothetical protein